MSPSHELYLTLLTKAREDAVALKKLIEAGGVSPWIIGFHGQQAVEKALKAVLAGRSIGYPYTHNIGSLLRVLQGAKIVLPLFADEIPRLTPLGALLRYEDEPGGCDRELPPPQAIIAWVDAVIEWAAGHLPPTAPPRADGAKVQEPAGKYSCRRPRKRRKP
jgi:HEPN domain-containing protein